MEKMCTYEVYHTTDASNVEKILNEGFRYKPNDMHWLGNGFYFFLDKSLAEKWAYDQIKGYGVIHNPAYIKCIIDINAEHVLDLRCLNEYNFAKECFSQFITDSKGMYDYTNCDKRKLRTMFFNYMKRRYKYNCVIAYFFERNLSKKIPQENLFSEFKVPYIEVQLCIDRNHFIIHKEEI